MRHVRFRDGQRLAVASVLLLAGLLAACGPSSSESPTFVSEPETGVYPAEDYRAGEPGRPGGTLKVAVALDTGSLDLHAITHTNAQWLGRLLFDNLVYLDEQGRPAPWLARSWEISEDGLTYTFHLRDDVTFSDGERFNAEALRVNLEHMRDPATKSPLAAAYIAPYEEGRVIDDYTFEARLREPYAAFLDVLAQSWLAIYSPKAIRESAARLNEAPVGSGPFVLESYQRQQGIRLVRRADYAWAPPVIGHVGPAYLERIQIDFVPEALIRYSALASGEYHLTLDAPPQNAAALRGNPALVFDKRIRKGNPSRTITFNTEKFPFEDARVRRAIALAVDREGLVRLSGFGEFAPKADFLAVNTRHYDPAFRRLLAHDPEQAERLLDEAGWSERDADGIRLRDGRRLSAEILLADGFVSTTDIVAIQSDLQKIGVELKIVALPLQQIVERRTANDYQALVTGVWHTNTPDGLYIQYHSNEIISPQRIGQNLSRLRDPQLDELLAKARNCLQPSVCQPLYSQAQERLTELVPAVPVYENYSLVGASRAVKGLIFDTSHNTLLFTHVWLDRP